MKQQPSYADLLYIEQNDNQQKLQHEAACLDFAAGANWKEEQFAFICWQCSEGTVVCFLDY